MVAACAATPPPCPPGFAPSDAATLVDRGWHVEIGLPAEDFTGDAAFLRDLFPGAKALVFGYGKRTFFTAKTDSLSEYLLGPVPGPAAIQITGLSAPVATAYPPGDVAVIALPPGGGARIADFLWNDIARDTAGGPKLIGPGPYPGSLFTAARSPYSLGHTCNAWVADALLAGGVALNPDGVVFSGQTMSRAVYAGACAPVK